MAIYLLTILFSLYIFYILKDRMKPNWVICIGIFVPAFIAGMRDTTVGTDTWFYAEPFYKEASGYNSLLDFLENAGRFEIGYALINYFTSLLFNDFHWFLFIIQYLTLYLVAKAVFINNSKQIVLSMAIYYFLFYNVSLNIIRQLVAVNLFLLAYVVLTKRKTLHSILIVLLSFCFHKSVIFIAPMLYFYNWMTFLKSKRYIVMVGCLISLYIIFSNLEYIINFASSFLSSSFTIFSNYAFYSTDYATQSSNVTEIILRFIFAAFVIWSIAMKKIDKQKGEIYVLLICTEIIILYTGTISQWVFRLTYFISILHVANLPTIISKYKSNRILYVLLILIPIIFVWYWLYIDHNVGDTMPYTSKILNL